MLSMNSVFHAERDGRPIPARSRLYGGAHFRCRGDGGQADQIRQYETSCFSVVTSGALAYASEDGAGLAGPGTIITGNEARMFSYRFPSGDPVVRSLVTISPLATAEVAADLGLSRADFPAPLIPPSKQTLRLYAAIRRLAVHDQSDDELALRTAAGLMTLGRPAPRAEPGRLERRRVAEVARYLDIAYAEPITLEQMAELANLSRFHFIRVFRQVVGENPRAYLIAARLRAAADRLMETREPVISVALNSGFNDISHFTNSFRRAFGVSPRQLRARA